MDTALTLLKQVFGFNQFRSLQEKIITSLLAGRDNFVLMPTGGGKSLCFQIPALMRPGVGIVVSPFDFFNAGSSERLESQWSCCRSL